MKRYSKTVAQQCKYYEVENIFEYMVGNTESNHLKTNYSPNKYIMYGRKD